MLARVGKASGNEIEVLTLPACVSGQKAPRSYHAGWNAARESLSRSLGVRPRRIPNLVEWQTDQRTGDCGQGTMSVSFNPHFEQPRMVRRRLRPSLCARLARRRGGL